MSEHTLDMSTELVLDDGTVLRRIVAGRDIPRHDVTAGDVGGWVERAEQVSGDAWVSGEVTE